MINKKLLIIILCSIIIVLIYNPYSIRIIKGDSMGDDYYDIIVIDTSVTFDDLNDGDAISFQNKCGTNVHHRLVKSNANENWYTKGDNNTVYDIGYCYSNPVQPDEFDEQLTGRFVTGIRLPFI